MLSQQQRVAILISTALVALIAVFSLAPMPQDPAYHLFADNRPLAGVSNFWNVLSNVPFLLAGLLGFSRYRRLAFASSTMAYWVLCLSVVLVSVGSAYYHFAPSNPTLLWDRLPMTVAFMALLALMLNERVLRPAQAAVLPLSPASSLLLWLLVVVGITAAWYWSWTEAQGRGDLRPYLLVQFLPILLMPLILLLFKPVYLSTPLLLGALVCYVIAKTLEHFDAALFVLTTGISGHATKHVVAAAAVLCLIYAVPTRPNSR